MSYRLPIVVDGKFPDPQQADAEGLLAIGGDLSPNTLLKAYSRGIFPWFNDQVPLWWSPDPRLVLFPAELKVSASMRNIRNQRRFTFTHNRCFRDVIFHCAHTSRAGQEGTWITEEMQTAYIRLHELGYAHSAEAWSDGKLVGGLYGIRLGQIFFGESMFAHQSNASKFAFIEWVRKLEAEGVILVDCQSHTHHLVSLGAKMIPREAFMQWLIQGQVSPIP
jgi:leucyl/phenylalanyl-tRNA---protein transferase